MHDTDIEGEFKHQIFITHSEKCLNSSSIYSCSYPCTLESKYYTVIQCKISCCSVLPTECGCNIHIVGGVVGDHQYHKIFSDEHYLCFWISTDIVEDTTLLQLDPLYYD